MKEDQTKKDVDIFEMVLESPGGGYSFDSKSSPINVDWQEDHQEGQLAVDVINTEKELVVVSTMAGADAEKVEVYIHNDLLTIRGARIMPVEKLEDPNYLHQECYWGRFSRTIVLPVDVKGHNAKAEYKNGVLTIKMPKQKIDSKISVTIVDE